MEAGYNSVKELRDRFEFNAYYKDKSQVFNTSRIEAFELKNLLDVAVSTAHSAFTREESRGAHSRVDFPNRNDQDWLCHSISFRDGRFMKRGVNNQPQHIDPVELQDRT